MINCVNAKPFKPPLVHTTGIFFDIMTHTTAHEGVAIKKETLETKWSPYFLPKICQNFESGNNFLISQPPPLCSLWKWCEVHRGCELGWPSTFRMADRS